MDGFLRLLEVLGYRYRNRWLSSLSSWLVRKTQEEDGEPKNLYFGALLCFLVYWNLSAWRDAQKNLKSVILQREKDTGDLGMCTSDLRTERTLKTSWQDRFADQQKITDSLRAPELQQEATINSCVVSLGKMNPRITAKTRALAFPVNGSMVQFEKNGPPVQAYFFEMIILTNTQREPRGTIKCDQAFRLISTPNLVAQLPGGMRITGGIDPTMSTSHEFFVSNSAAFWTDQNPVWFSVVSTEKDLGACTFKPPE